MMVNVERRVEIPWDPDTEDLIITTNSVAGRNHGRPDELNVYFWDYKKRHTGGLYIKFYSDMMYSVFCPVGSHRYFPEGLLPKETHKTWRVVYSPAELKVVVYCNEVEVLNQPIGIVCSGAQRWSVETQRDWEERKPALITFTQWYDTASRQYSLVGKGDRKGKSPPSEWTWATGETTAEYENWLSGAGQPGQATLNYGEKGCQEAPKCYQDQMRISHEGLWDDTFKFREHPYACDYQGKYILSGVRRSWEDARGACQAAGLTMAKVRSPEESDEMQAAIRYFLGAMPTIRDEEWETWNHANNWIWLGGTDSAEEGVWTWTDGSPIGWRFRWARNFGGNNSKRNSKMGIRMEAGQDALRMNRDGLFDDSFARFSEGHFACQCPGT